MPLSLDRSVVRVYNTLSNKGVRTSTTACPVGWGGVNTPTESLQKDKTPPNDCPGYDTKQSDGEDPVMLGLWGIGRTPSLPSLPGPLWHGMVALSMD